MTGGPKKTEIYYDPYYRDYPNGAPAFFNEEPCLGRDVGGPYKGYLSKYICMYVYVHVGVHYLYEKPFCWGDGCKALIKAIYPCAYTYYV